MSAAVSLRTIRWWWARCLVKCFERMQVTCKRSWSQARRSSAMRCVRLLLPAKGYSSNRQHTFCRTTTVLRLATLAGRSAIKADTHPPPLLAHRQASQRSHHPQWSPHRQPRSTRPSRLLARRLLRFQALPSPSSRHHRTRREIFQWCLARQFLELRRERRSRRSRAAAVAPVQSDRRSENKKQQAANILLLLGSTTEGALASAAAAAAWRA
mmetsp:Transcript_48388/g.115052  ORF Transcript_48388/g.115052 Transcript_48388/m.115052 type:complete len:212 (+) Transcript_48388:3475-4110(+)